jgi:anti-sigma regulatory factor (Ser/Thr protein kinase)
VETGTDIRAIQGNATQVPARRPFSCSGVSLLGMAWDAKTAQRAPAAPDALTGPPSRRPAGDGPLPPPAPGAMSYAYTTDLAAVRAVVYRYARQAGLPEARAVDLVLAVSEVAANTVRHAKSPGSLKIWYDTEEIVCQIQDEGTITDPLAGRRQPSLEATGGHGLWIVNQVCDEVEIRSDETGTMIRLHMGLPQVRPGS